MPDVARLLRDCYAMVTLQLRACYALVRDCCTIIVHCCPACRYAVSDDMKAAMAKLEQDEKAAEAEAEAGAAPVFKKRKAGQGGFRKKTGI